ncbi:MAG: archaellin/type IV pilin N-terminal domain-containing protein [Candidatus Hodarchaeales archaeon]|jgi:FlaG/FlaF family flagellin (archaellin)
MMNLKHLRRKKSRGVTPVIATILLIGLVVVAGIIISVVMFGTINSPAPLKVEIISISDFETTDDDIFVDQFSVSIHNKERTSVRIKYDAFTLIRIESGEFNLTGMDETPMSGWSMNPDQSEIILSAKAIEDFTLICDTTEGDELIPDNDTIYIEITVSPKDSTSDRLAKTFRSDLLSIGSTHGPMSLVKHSLTLNLEDAGLNINFTVTNNGSADTILKLELYTDSPQKITFNIDGVNRTNVLLTLSGYNNKILNTTVFPTSEANVGDSYIVFAFLWNQETMELVDSVNFILTY